MTLLTGIAIRVNIVSAQVIRKGLVALKRSPPLKRTAEGRKQMAGDG
jgi:hypothetical protein